MSPAPEMGEFGLSLVRIGFRQGLTSEDNILYQIYRVRTCYSSRTFSHFSTVAVSGVLLLFNTTLSRNIVAVYNYYQYTKVPYFSEQSGTRYGTLVSVSQRSVRVYRTLT